MTLEMAESLGRVLILIVGDFNLNLDSHGLSHIMQGAGWADTCQGVGPTCKGSAGTGTESDYALWNNYIRGMVQNASIHWDSGIATHALLNISLRGGPAKQGTDNTPST